MMLKLTRKVSLFARNHTIQPNKPPILYPNLIGMPEPRIKPKWSSEYFERFSPRKMEIQNFWFSYKHRRGFKNYDAHRSTGGDSLQPWTDSHFCAVTWWGSEILNPFTTLNRYPFFCRDVMEVRNSESLYNPEQSFWCLSELLIDYRFVLVSYSDKNFWQGDQKFWFLIRL